MKTKSSNDNMPVKIENYEDARGRRRQRAEPGIQSRFSPERRKEAILSSKEPVGGAHTASYEQFVQRLFTPGNTKISRTYPDTSMSNSLSKLNDWTDSVYDTGSLYSPLVMLAEYGVYNKPEPQFHVYRTKSSSEYFATLNKKPMIYETPSLTYKAAKTATCPNIYDAPPCYDKDRYRLSLDWSRQVAPERTKHMLIDYKEFPSSPLSPFLYPKHYFVHREDSRILCSDFVMLSLRPNDTFLNKVDKTLAEAKKFNRWS